MHLFIYVEGKTEQRQMELIEELNDQISIDHLNDENVVLLSWLAGCLVGQT